MRQSGPRESSNALGSQLRAGVALRGGHPTMLSAAGCDAVAGSCRASASRAPPSRTDSFAAPFAAAPAYNYKMSATSALIWLTRWALESLNNKCFIQPYHCPASLKKHPASAAKFSASPEGAATRAKAEIFLQVTAMITKTSSRNTDSRGGSEIREKSLPIIFRQGNETADSRRFSHCCSYSRSVRDRARDSADRSGSFNNRRSPIGLGHSNLQSVEMHIPLPVCVAKGTGHGTFSRALPASLSQSAQADEGNSASATTTCFRAI
jgi:hypothetical protein